MIKRMNIDITADRLEHTQFRNLLTPGANKVSSQRLQLVQSQWDSMVMILNPEYPMFQSSMIQSIITKSTCIKKLRGTIKLLKKITFQDIDYYIYEKNGVANIFVDEKYTVDNNFATRTYSDFELLEEGEEYDLNDEDANFMMKYPRGYDPVSQTMGYGANVKSVISGIIENTQDSVAVSERFARKFCTLRTKVVNVNLNGKKIVSRYPGIFPKLGEFINDTVLFKVVKDDRTPSSIAQDPNSPVGYEDESINLEPYTYINRIEVFCNNIIDDPILNEYREDLLRARSELVRFVDKLDIPISEVLMVFRNNFMYDKYRNENKDLKDPLIKIYTKTVSLSASETKLTTLSGGKVTITSVYPDKKFKDEFGDTIDLIYPSNSLVNRTISQVLYEVHFNSIAMFMQKAVREKSITPERLKECVVKLLESIGKSEEARYLFQNMSSEDLFEYLKDNPFTWSIDPYDMDLVLSTANDATYIAEEYLGWRPIKLFNNGIEVTEHHVVGNIFMMRLLNDRYTMNSGCSIPKRDTRGHIIDKSSSKKEGRSIFGEKPSKFSILAIHKILNTMSNESASIMLRENNYTMHGTHELSESVGFVLETTRVVKNREIVTELDVIDD